MKFIQVTCRCGYTRPIPTHRTTGDGYTGRCSACYQREASERSGKSRHFTGQKISSWKVSARSRNRAWALSNDDLDGLWERQGGRCALTGWVMDKETGDRLTAASLDRIDPTGGYTVENVQFVLNIANIAKNNLTPEGFVNLARAVVETHARNLENLNGGTYEANEKAVVA